jgi:hypothetical protein
MRVKHIEPGKQEQLIDKLEHLVLSEEKAFTLYNMDNDKPLQEQIMGLVDELRDAFYIHNFTGVNRPDGLKRPWLSIIRTLLGKRYKIIIEDYRDKEKMVRTKRYNFIPKTT